jgi:hypothetical protein
MTELEPNGAAPSGPHLAALARRATDWLARQQELKTAELPASNGSGDRGEVWVLRIPSNLAELGFGAVDLTIRLSATTMSFLCVAFW